MDIENLCKLCFLRLDLYKFDFVKFSLNTGNGYLIFYYFLRDYYMLKIVRDKVCFYYNVFMVVMV